MGEGNPNRLKIRRRPGGRESFGYEEGLRKVSEILKGKNEPQNPEGAADKIVENATVKIGGIEKDNKTALGMVTNLPDVNQNDITATQETLNEAEGKAAGAKEELIDGGAGNEQLDKEKEEWNNIVRGVEDAHIKLIEKFMAEGKENKFNYNIIKREIKSELFVLAGENKDLKNLVKKYQLGEAIKQVIEDVNNVIDKNKKEKKKTKKEIRKEIVINEIDEKDFFKGLESVKSKEELLGYLNSFSSVRTSGREGSIHFPAYTKKVEKVFRGEIGIKEIYTPTLREKIKELRSIEARKIMEKKKAEGAGREETKPAGAEKKTEEKIRKAKSYEDLVVIINEIGGIKGSRNYFPAADLITLVKGVLRGDKNISVITRNFGLRSKVEELLEEENKFKNKISEIKTIDELKKALTEKKEIRGGRGNKYAAEEIIKIIDDNVSHITEILNALKNLGIKIEDLSVRSIFFNGMTYRYGIREKFVELLKEKLKGEGEEKEKKKEEEQRLFKESLKAKSLEELKQEVELLKKQEDEIITRRGEEEKLNNEINKFGERVRSINDVNALKNDLKILSEYDAEELPSAEDDPSLSKEWLLESKKRILESRIKELEFVGIKEEKGKRDEEPAPETKPAGAEEKGAAAPEIKEKAGEKVSVEDKFGKLGIKKEDLEKIEGFNNLTIGQQLLILENLKQLTLGRVQEEAHGKYQKEMAGSRWGGRMWKGITKKYQIAKAEKEKAEEIYKGGIKIHKEVLQQLTNGMLEMGLEVKEKDGKLEIQYAGGFENLTPEKQKIVDEFNDAANLFGGTPDEWKYKAASKNEQKSYKETESRYEKAKISLLTLKKEKDGEREAALYINDIEGKIKINQFLNTHPGVEEQLKNIKDKNLWRQVMKDIVTERGIYATAGFLTRTFTISMIGLAGAPLAAAGLGGFLARKRAKEATRENIKAARKGEKGRAKELGGRLENAGDLTSELKQLMDIINDKEEFSKEERDEAAKTLGAVINRIEKEINDGLVNYGGGAERLQNQYGLINNLFSSKTMVVAQENDVLQKRLNQFIEAKEGRMSKTQKKYLRDQMIRGAIISAGFATVGYAIRHFLFEGGIFKETPPTGEKPGGAELPKTGSGKSESLSDVKEVPPAGKPVPAAPADAEAPKAPAISPEQMESATVGKGEGVWHAVRRQIEDLMNKDPEAFAERFNLTTEDFDTKAEIKTVLDRETMELLVKNKYINLENKTETRIFNPGTRVILGEDNKINIVDEDGVQAKVYETELGKVEGRGGLPKELPDSGAAADVLRDAEWIKSGVEAVEGKPGAQWARIDYPNDYKLRMVAIDADGNSAPEEIRILNENNEVIKFSILDSQKGESIKDFVARAKEESGVLIETRNSAFKDIVGDKITMAQAKEAGLNVFTKEDLLPAAKEKLTFWSEHANLLRTPEAAKEYFTLSEATKIDYKLPDFQEHFPALPSDFDGTQKEGFMEIHAGTNAQKEDGLIKLFGEEIRKSGSVDEKTENFFTKKNDMFIIHDACGKKGFDILITKDKIGVDGPWGWNWGVKGWFDDVRPTRDFNNLGIKTTKTVIESMSKELENRQPAALP